MSDNMTFVDSRGVSWEVAEGGVSEREGDGRMPGDYLSFESANEVRRLWRYPDDWRRLGAVQLERLCAQAHVVIARFRPRPAWGDGDSMRAER